MQPQYNQQRQIYSITLIHYRYFEFMKRIVVAAVGGIMVLGMAARDITGRVVDDDDAAMEYVNAVAINRADSAYITGCVTDADGRFLFHNMPDSADVLVRLTSVGFTPVTCAVPPSGDVGTVSMAPQTLMLGEVVVKSDRPVTAIRGNALVTNIDNTVLAHAGTANDVLAQVPMVLGHDGKFTVFGKGTPLIYINGRKMQDVHELQELSSEDIKNVEVITNPGARYEASVKSVIRITTKRPQGEGWSGLLRERAGFRPYFLSSSQANIKYRTGGLEAFGNFGFATGHFSDGNTNDISTRTASHVLHQNMDIDSKMGITDFFGTLGVSYLFNEKHSIGTRYVSSYSTQDQNFNTHSEVSINDMLTDRLTMNGKRENDNYPYHSANVYYNGTVGKTDLDLNVDYRWDKNRNTLLDRETSLAADNAEINSRSTTHSRLFAEKFIVGHPVWKGRVEVGEEYTTTRFKSVYDTDASQITDADTRVDENNIAAFVDFSQQFGKWNAQIGLRYEHVNYKYFEGDILQDQQSRSYNNFFPSFALSTTLRNVQLSLNYSYKTQRPSYSSLDGAVRYINRFTLESGNPYLQPEKIQTVELTGSWRQFFAQLSYTYKKDPILDYASTYQDDEDVKLYTKLNFPHIHYLSAFVGSRFKVGIWEPNVNVGLRKQWLTVDYDGGRKKLDNPRVMIQWQNAIHLPWDTWLNIDMEWMSDGNEENRFAKSASDFGLNAKLYKAFFNNTFSVTLEAYNIFNKRNYHETTYCRDVTVYMANTTNNREYWLTLQYTFNATNDRYRGRGAGATEKSRL